MANQKEIYQVFAALGFKETELDKAPIEWLEHAYKRVKETAVLAMFEAANNSIKEQQKEKVRDTFSNIGRCCRCLGKGYLSGLSGNMEDEHCICGCRWANERSH